MPLAHIVCLTAAVLGGDNASIQVSAESGLWVFQGLGDVPGGLSESQARGVSADGGVVVGWGSRSDGVQATRWSYDTGLTTLGDLVGGPDDGGMPDSRALGVSGNGEITVGMAVNALGVFQAVMWNEVGDVSALLAPVEGLDCRASGASRSGHSIVGWTATVGDGADAVLWRQQLPPVVLGHLPGGSDLSVASAVSGTGNVVVGWSSAGIGPFHAFRWTPAGGMEDLGTLPFPLANSSQAFGVSDDGVTVVGTTWSSNGLQAFCWNEEQGMVGLGDLPGGGFLDFSFATDAADDGSAIVGFGQTDLGTEAFLWTEQLGMELLGDILIADGNAQVEEWVLVEARSMSADGRTIVGWGRRNGIVEAWMARLTIGPCLGDFDSNGFVGQSDLVILLDNLGDDWPPGDLDGNGTVGVEDLAALLGEWGACP